MDTLLQTVARKATKGILRLIYAAVEGIAQEVVNRGGADIVVSSRLDRLTESKGFTKNIVGCLFEVASIYGSYY